MTESISQTQGPSQAGDHPLISVIIATYNREAFVAEAIDSVLAQTWPNFEILVVDDGSTDDTQSVLARYRDDPRITLIYQENQKRAAAFNNALQYAKGEFIGILDSDNRWLPHRLAREMEVFEAHPEVDIVYANNITIDEKGRETTRMTMRRYSGYITRELWRDNCVSINTTLVRRKCFDEMGGMDPSCKRSDDYELWLRFSTRYRFLHIPEYVAEYRVMTDQLSTDKRARFAAGERILSNFQKRYPNAMTEAEFRQGWAAFYTRKARYFASVGDRREAVSAIAKALRYRPLSTITWRGLARVILPKPAA